MMFLYQCPLDFKQQLIMKTKQPTYLESNESDKRELLKNVKEHKFN